MTAPRAVLALAPSTRERLASAESALLERGPADRVTLIGHGLEAANALARHVAKARPGSATYGVSRTTFPLFLGALARPVLASAGVVAASRLNLEAVAARLAESARASLGRFAEVAKTPGFSRALVRTLDELRLERTHSNDPALDALEEAYASALHELRLADGRAVADAAVRSLEQRPLSEALVVLWDVRLASRTDEAVLAALGAKVDLFVSLPEGDTRSLAVVRRALPHLVVLEPSRATERPAEARPSALVRLQRELFAESHADPNGVTSASDPPREGPSSGTESSAISSRSGEEGTRVRSAPGESRECVELARTVLEEASRGVPFDRMAILLRSPETYVPHVVEALRRAKIPAYFARGLRLPDPAGRALLALLACAQEGLSAKRFAEYLSLGESVRTRDVSATARTSLGPDTFVPLDDEERERLGARSTESPEDDDETTPDLDEPESTEQPPGTFRTPSRWERWLVEAAVIGGLERWKRRLTTLRADLTTKHAASLAENDGRATIFERDLASVNDLESYALPLLTDLETFTTPCSWREWLERLSSLAVRALRRPTRVLSVLGELSPLDSATEITLSEVRAVLEPRLADVRTPTKGRRLGKLFVGAVEDARGLTFDTVLVPGLVEKAFPKKVLEDPLLLDEARLATGTAAEGAPRLATNAERSEDERLMLRLATGAAERLVSYSYPRVDTDAGRPRTPSFYGLEILRVVRGQLPTYEALKELADRASHARLGWPAPESPEVALDDAEHDLSVLATLLGNDESKNVGAARFLLGGNPHLRRALYARAYRWRKGKYVAQDGLVDVPPLGRPALDAHALSARSYSPTALQHFAGCPYRFYLSALLKLAPREEPEPLEELDPLQRGTLVHETQYAWLTRMRAEGKLPLLEADVPAAQSLLDETLSLVSERHRDTLCPSIPRVWEDGLAQVRADLREWVRRIPLEAEWNPTHFELSFGLIDHDEGRDAASVKDPIELECGLRLRGSIDLVETHTDGTLRATDHKTGKVRADKGSVVSGGEVLQPVLYALAVEKLLPGKTVSGGRLYYCTQTGDYTPIEVPLDTTAREAVATVKAAVDEALTTGMLPALPGGTYGCKYCDFRPVCGPYEEIRIKQKRDPRAMPLLRKVRELP
jgi:ATP-dependent helicase/nuclease subunit B